ncbi:MAG: hypothetical protein KDA37_01370 [Planctomycetales bacterium]|nr:hypothetical protein [Planctomycetales bacterium]
MAFARYALFPVVAALLCAAPNLADAQWWAYRHAAHMNAMHNAHMAHVHGAPPASVSVDTPYFSYHSGVPAPAGPGYQQDISWSGPHGFGGVSVSVAKPVVEVHESAPAPPAAPEMSEDFGAEQYDTPEAQLASEHAALMARLELYNGGDGWQSYLSLPEGGEADQVQRGKLLRRMESIAQDSQFSKIAYMPEFRRVYQTLQRMESEPAPQFDPEGLEGTPGKSPAAPVAESLPAPEPQPAADKVGEHSVLKPTN